MIWRLAGIGKKTIWGSKSSIRSGQQIKGFVPMF
jgi:hypothetical protein